MPPSSRSGPGGTSWARCFPKPELAVGNLSWLKMLLAFANALGRGLQPHGRSLTGLSLQLVDIAQGPGRARQRVAGVDDPPRAERRADGVQSRRAAVIAV